MKYVFKTALFLLAFIPGISLAQNRSIQTLFNNLIEVLSNVIVPFLWGMAFLMFVWNAVRYFVFESHSEEGREKAKALMAWGIAAFVFVSIFWGVINMLTQSSGLTGDSQPCPDYIRLFNPDRCQQQLPNP